MSRLLSHGAVRPAVAMHGWGVGMIWRVGAMTGSAVVETLEERAVRRGADLVLEGGGVKGIGVAGAVITLSDAGYVFPRVGGTSAGAIVAALIAAYQTKNVPLSQLETDMRDLQYSKFRDQSFFDRHLGLAGLADALIRHQGLYSTKYLSE